MICKYPNCGKPEDHPRHDFKTINMPISLENHTYEPAESAAAAPRMTDFSDKRCSVCGCKRLTTGVCSYLQCTDPMRDFFAEDPTAPADSTPQRFCNCPVISPRQVEDGECSLCGLELEPEANSTRTEMPPSVMDDHKGVQAAKKWMQELLGHVGIGHITYACFEDKSGKGWSVPQLLNAYLSHLAASVQQEPLSAEPDPWKRIKQQWAEIEKLKQSLKEHVAKIRNQREEINRLQAAAPRTQGSEQSFEEFWMSTNNRNYFSVRPITVEILNQVAKESWDAAIAAQPQPATLRPACPNPKCGSDNIKMYRPSDYKNYDYVAFIQCEECSFDTPAWKLSDFAQFFTAIPATTLEVISGAKVVKVDAEALKNYAGKKLKDVSGFDDTNPAPAITDEEKR